MTNYNSMSFKSLILRLTILLVCIHNVYTSNWNYQDQNEWTHESEYCDANQQSPINIDLGKIAFNSSLQLDFLNYDNPMISFSAENNYHSIQFHYIGDAGSAPTLSGSALNNEKFQLDNFHFHWGQTRGEGSEHTVDDRAYSMEIHFVHFNKKYKTLKQALSKHYGVAVLGVFVEIEKVDNDRFSVVADMASEVKHNQKEVRVNAKEPIHLNEMLPHSRDEFFRYEGSLTTPPCTEQIEWTVLAHPIRIGLDQIKEFREAMAKDSGKPVGNNYRDIQKLGNRVVQSSFDVGQSDQDSGSRPLTPGSLSVVILLAAVSSIVMRRLNL